MRVVLYELTVSNFMEGSNLVVKYHSFPEGFVNLSAIFRKNLVCELLSAIPINAGEINRGVADNSITPVDDSRDFCPFRVAKNMCIAAQVTVDERWFKPEIFIIVKKCFLY